MASTFDATIRHQIRLERAKAGERRETRNLLRPVDAEILEIVRNLPSGYTKAQEDFAVSQIQEIINRFYGTDLRNHFIELASDTVDVESAFSAGIMQLLLEGTDIDVNDVPKADVMAAGFKKSYQGHKMSTWTKMLGNEKFTRVKRALRQGRLEELKKQLIIQNVRKQFNISNQHAETITTTYINNFSNITREMYDKANPKAVEVILWSAILDLSTTTICRDRADKLYDAKTKEPIGHNFEWGAGPGSIHFNCRSIGIRLDRDEIPDRDEVGETSETSLSLIIRGRNG